MKCEEARKHIYPLLDDELETETNIEVLGHLNVCDRCQEKFEAEREFLQKLSSSLTDREVPEDVREDIQKRLEEAREKNRDTWLSRNKSWDYMMSAAVFLLLVITAGVLSNYFPLNSTSDEFIQTFPEYHQEVLDRKKESFQTQVSDHRFQSISDIKNRIAKKFPVFRKRLQIPSMDEKQCKILEGATYSATQNHFGAPNFHVMYCYLGDRVAGEKKHEGVMLVGIERPDINLDQFSNLTRLSGSDTLYINRDSDRQTHCIFWTDESFLYALITSGLSRDHLSDLARSARKQIRSSNTPEKRDQK